LRVDLVYGRGEAVMKPIRLCRRSVVVLVLGFAVLSIALSGSAFAQKPGVNFKGDKPPADPKSEAEKKRIDQEYQSTLKAIPDQPQKKVDPWAKIRNPAPAQK
jgi:hypothetical protein